MIGAAEALGLVATLLASGTFLGFIGDRRKRKSSDRVVMATEDSTIMVAELAAVTSRVTVLERIIDASNKFNEHLQQERAAGHLRENEQSARIRALEQSERENLSRIESIQRELHEHKVALNRERELASSIKKSFDQRLQEVTNAYQQEIRDQADKITNLEQEIVRHKGTDTGE